MKRSREKESIPAPGIETGSIDARPRRIGKLGKTVLFYTGATVAVVSLAVLGSHLPIGDAPKPKVVPVVPTIEPVAPLSASAAKTALENFHSPISACDPEFDLYANSDVELQDKDAQACLDDEENAKVAFVNYDLTPAVAKTLASDIEHIYNDKAGDSIHVEVSVVEASKEARALFEQETPDGCVEGSNDSDVTDFPSYDAAVMMPSLGKFNKILAETDEQECGDNDGGAAVEADGDTEVANRYAAIFDMEGFFSEDSIASIGAHELGHLFGLGHSGTLISVGGGTLNNLVQNSSSTESATLDLDDYIAAGTYNEYAGHTMMGDVYGDLKRKDNFNVPQEYFLDWPNRILDKPASVSVTDLASNIATFNNDTSVRSIAVLNLEQPLFMPDQSETSAGYQGQQFNEIAFVPRFKKGVLEGVGVYMLGVEDSTVYLGTLENTVEGVPANYVLSVGGRLLQITVDQTTHTVLMKEPQYSLK